MVGQTDRYHKLLGIPPKEQPPTHYRLLGLAAFESDHDVIDAAADRQMIYLRTLRNGDAEQLLNEVARARICLLDRTKKAEYDRSLLGEPEDCKLDPGAIDPATTIEDEDIDLDRELSGLALPMPEECELGPMLFEIIDRNGPLSRCAPLGPYSASEILKQVLVGHIYDGMEIRNLPDGEWYSIIEWMGTFYYGSSDPAKSDGLSGMEQELGDAWSEQARSPQRGETTAKTPDDSDIPSDVATFVIVAFIIMFFLWIVFAG